jgi:hypothetical protein
MPKQIVKINMRKSPFLFVYKDYITNGHFYAKRKHVEVTGKTNLCNTARFLIKYIDTGFYEIVRDLRNNDVRFEKIVMQPHMIRRMEHYKRIVDISFKCSENNKISLSQWSVAGDCILVNKDNKFVCRMDKIYKNFIDSDTFYFVFVSKMFKHPILANTGKWILLSFSHNMCMTHMTIEPFPTGLLE